ncbi:MAG: 2-C-methyl-D-erythritol 4-phosphate cytidylyltransferase [Lysobacterales bacterium]|jgi:2-C-methyl-D-erythritol 4-phosphate cytidylyltransferase
MIKAQAIIPCAGIGARLKTDVSKPFVEIAGQPLFIHTLVAFEKSAVDSIVLVVHVNEVENVKSIVSQQDFNKKITIIVGGNTRRDSVNNGLQSIDEDTQIVVVHDAARPLIDPSIIDKSIEQCVLAKAIIVAVPAKSTMKEVQDGLVLATLDRNRLWEVQTPQTFEKELLKEAHAQEISIEATDDSMLVENLGVPVKILEGEYKNIKVTTVEDLEIVESFLK